MPWVWLRYATRLNSIVRRLLSNGNRVASSEAKLAAWGRVRRCRSARQLASAAPCQQAAVSGDRVGLRRRFQASVVGSRVYLPRAVHRGKLAPNNSFKPNLLRYGKSVAEKACHAFASTTQVGLTQALGGAGARMDNWTSFVAIALLLGASGGVSATVLAIRLRRDFPDLHRAIDAPTGQERTPFWVFHFLSPAKWRLLPQPWKPWMLLSIVAMSTGVALFLFFLFKFAIGELV